MGLLSGLGALPQAGGGNAMANLLPLLLGQGGQTPPIAPPQQPQGGMPGAFSGNPQFMQQLQAIMQGQGPGMSAPQFTPPAFQMSTAPLNPQEGPRSWRDRLRGGMLGGGLYGAL